MGCVADQQCHGMDLPYVSCAGMLLVNPLRICCSMNLTKEQYKETFALYIMCDLRCGEYNMHQKFEPLDEILSLNCKHKY